MLDAERELQKLADREQSEDEDQDYLGQYEGSREARSRARSFSSKRLDRCYPEFPRGNELRPDAPRCKGLSGKYGKLSPQRKGF